MVTAKPMSLSRATEWLGPSGGNMKTPVDMIRPCLKVLFNEVLYLPTLKTVYSGMVSSGSR